MRPSCFEVLEPRRLLSGAPTLAIGDAWITEGNAGSRYAAVEVSLSAPTKKTVSVNYGTTNGSALAGSDYDATSGKVTFAPGETTKSILVPVRGDRLPESDESFAVNLQAAKNIKVTRGQATVTIVDDEPRVSITGAGADEGDSGKTSFVFTVNLSRAYDQPVTVNFATQDDSAVAGVDYLAASGTLTFAAGETAKLVTVEVLGNTTPEPYKGFYVNLAGASANALISGGQGYGSIWDDDGYVDPNDSGGGYDSDPWSYWPGYYWY